MNPISVTFDSNVWECVANTEKLVAHTDADALQAIREAIKSKALTPYISDVIVTLEAVKKRDRADFFANLQTTARVSERQENLQENGEASLVRKITIQTSFAHHPGLHEKLSQALQEALALGFKFINVPRIGWMRFDEHLYKPCEIDDGALGRRLNRTYAAVREFEAKGFGAAHIKALGDRALQSRPDLASRGIGPFRAFAYSDETTKIPSAVAEWADGDALAAHYGYEIDIFCTLDRGRNAGLDSVLHQRNRQWLKDQFGINVLTPAELADIISSVHRD